MAYVDLLPRSYQVSVMAVLNDPGLGERAFVSRLKQALKSCKMGHEYFEVLQYETNRHDW